MTFYNFNHKRAALTRIGKRYFIGRNLNYAGSFEVDLLAMTKIGEKGLVSIRLECLAAATSSGRRLSLCMI